MPEDDQSRDGAQRHQKRKVSALGANDGGRAQNGNLGYREHDANGYPGVSRAPVDARGGD